jgi:hypothetical protein
MDDKPQPIVHRPSSKGIIGERRIVAIGKLSDY